MEYFNKKFEEFASRIKKDLVLCIETRLQDFKTEINSIVEKMIKMEEHISTLETRIDNMEMEHRSCDLIVSGVPVTKNENVREIVERVGRAINYHFDNKIYQTFRLPIKSSKLGTAPPIVVKFPFKYLAVEFFAKYKIKKHLCLRDIDICENSTSRIYINGGLTAKNSRIFNEAKRIQKNGIIFKVYVKSGLIYAMKSFSSEPVLLKNVAYIHSLTKADSDVMTNTDNGNSNATVKSTTKRLPHSNPQKQLSISESVTPVNSSNLAPDVAIQSTSTDLCLQRLTRAASQKLPASKE